MIDVLPFFNRGSVELHWSKVFLVAVAYSFITSWWFVTFGIATRNGVSDFLTSPF